MKLASCFGFTIQMKNELVTEEIRNSFKIFQNNGGGGYIRIFELIDFDIRRSIFITL